MSEGGREGGREAKIKLMLFMLTITNALSKHGESSTQGRRVNSITAMYHNLMLPVSSYEQRRVEPCHMAWERG